MRIYLTLLGLAIICCFWLFCSNQSKPKLIVTAHRGASELAPENTIAAMLQAIEFKSDFAELDVQETKDGEIILLHDDDLERTTNDSGVIWEKNFSDLDGVDAGGWKDAKYANEPIPKLSAVIDSVNGKIKLNIEIKINGHQEDIARRVVDIIEKKNFIDQCLVTSFHRPTVEEVKRLNPQIKVGLIFGEMPKEDIFSTDWGLFSVYHKLIDQAFVEKAHRANKEVHVWTVNEPELMRKFIGYGVDSIITNRPDVLQEVLAGI